jgi:hemerythrin superfamily protein
MSGHVAEPRASRKSLAAGTRPAAHGFDRKHPLPFSGDRDMSLAFHDTFQTIGEKFGVRRLDEAGARLGAELRGRRDVLARAADKEMRLASKATWPRVASAAAVGFVVGVAVLGGRKAVMQAATGMAGDWLAALKADHRLVDSLFGLLEQTGDAEVGKRRLLFSKIAYALAKHQFEEEHVVYPTLAETGPAEVPRHLDAEHFEMKSFTHELMQMPADDPKWLKKAKALHRLIQAHVREEEEIVFPRLEERLDRKAKAKLTRALHREGIKLA